jgi:DNA topoisomerase-3
MLSGVSVTLGQNNAHPSHALVLPATATQKSTEDQPMNILYLCEKPAQARDIASVLGVHERADGCIRNNSTTITWCLGHLLELAPPEHYCDDLKPWRMSVLPVLPKVWQHLPEKKTQGQLNIIKKLLNTADKVVIATDADRQGDLIGREVLAYCQYQGPIERLWLSALDDTSIKKALADIRPGTSTEPLYQAGLAQQRADWLFGMNLTMATSHLFGVAGQGVLSVGRVQTPTLNLIVERDRTIQNFHATDFYQARIHCSSEHGTFWAQWQPADDFTDEAGHCLKQAVVQSVVDRATDQHACVTHFSDTPKTQAAPLCFSLSGLQKTACARLGFSAKHTLEIAQSLYERHKATTYPRTDTGYLPESQWSEAPELLQTLGTICPALKPLLDQCDHRFTSPVWNNKKVTAHHGIIPTMNAGVSLEAMSTEEQQIYDWIVRSYIAQFLGNYDTIQRKVTLECAQETFSTSTSLPKTLGWKQAIIPTTDDSTEEQTEIPTLQTNDQLAVLDACVLTKKTKPLAHFSEGTLIAAMKNIAQWVDDPHLKKTLKGTAGIGTEATRADMIEKLLCRGYIERKKKQLLSTERGRALIDILPPQIKSPGTTALWEQTLDDIAKDNARLNDFLLDQEDVLEFMLEDLVSLRASRGKGIDGSTQYQYPCPLCKAPLARRKGKHGFFWSCTRYPDCKGRLQDKSGQPVQQSNVTLSEHHCPICQKGRLIRRKSKKGKGFWWGCSAYPECKARCSDLKGNPTHLGPVQEPPDARSHT